MHDLAQCHPVLKMRVITQNLLTCLASLLCPSGNEVAALPCRLALSTKRVGSVLPGSA